jgi:hypothetical protein
VLAGWGIFHAQPIVLNERQVGAAIEGVLRQEEIEIVQLAVDTHGYVGMAVSHGAGFDMCPRLKALKDRHLFLPRGCEVLVMAWNTAKMQAIFDRLAKRRNGVIPPELIARCAPTRTEGLNMRGIFRFPIELYLEQLLPSWASPEIQLLEP